MRLILGSLSILLNGVLLMAIAVERRRLLVSRISYLVANLAVADFLIGVVLVFIFQPIKIYEKPRAIQDLEIPLSWGSNLVSFLTLFLMSAERFVVVALPTLWVSILTTRRTIIGICIIWCLAIIDGIVAHFHTKKTMFVTIIVMEVCVVVFIGTHLYIFFFLKKPRSPPQPPDDDVGERTAMTTWSSTAEASSHVTMKQHREVATVAAKHREIATVVAILLAVLTLTMVPNFICVQIILVRETNVTRIGDLNKYDFYQLLHYTDALSIFNFVVNPIVYAWRLSMYRRAFVTLCLISTVVLLLFVIGLRRNNDRF